MECLKNVIGIRQACQVGALPAPRFGLYIEDYPGLTRTTLQAIEPGVWLNCQAFLDDLVRQAWTTIVHVDANAALEPYMREREALEWGLLGQFDEDEDITYGNGVAAPVGLKVKKSAGVFGRLSVASVWIQAGKAGTFTLTVTDGVNPLSMNVEVPMQEAIQVWVHYETDRDTVKITIADDDFQPATGNTKKTKRFSTCHGCTGLYKYQTLCASGLVDGVEAEDLQGIVAEAGITCSVEPALCILAPRLKVPVFYAVVIKALETWSATNRMNFVAQHKMDWVEANLAHLRTNLYPQAWDLHAKGLAAFASQLDSLCVDCGTGTNAGYGRP